VFTVYDTGGVFVSAERKHFRDFKACNVHAETLWKWLLHKNTPGGVIVTDEINVACNICFCPHNLPRRSQFGRIESKGDANVFDYEITTYLFSQGERGVQNA
jgi:hypothetical protein